jgi:DNA mismatch repair ATPase MutS
MTIPEKEYSGILDGAVKEHIRWQRLHNRISWLRLALFVAAILFFYLALTRSETVFWFVLSGSALVLLISLVYLSATTAVKRDYFSRLKSLAQKELDALKFEFLQFPDGAEFINNSHAYSSDIDLFGQGSLYQYINRTVTPMGCLRLVDWLESPCLDSKEIRARQEACKELSADPARRLHFAASGQESPEAGTHERLVRWSQLPDLFRNHSLWIIVIRFWQVVMLALLLTVIAGIVPYQVLILVAFVNLAVVGAFIGKINRTYRIFDKSLKQLETYRNLIGKVNAERVNSIWMSERLKALGTGEYSAATEMAKLNRLLHRFDSRNNLLVGFFRDALFLTDISLVLKMEVWRGQNKDNVRLWLDALGDVDAMNSLATYAYNNPSYCFPEVAEGAFCLESRDLGHPLISYEERMCNHFSITDWHKLVVLTGANMAGKSTFLRTVGINQVLAHTGAPVCASFYRFSPVSLITSIRTNDSLIKHESYFYAELKKLRHIIESLERGNEVFILLDEVLKGTNSNDKLNGSKILVSKLLGMKTSGIIATHDIALGEMEKDFPGKIINCCFEAQIQDGQLVFDYKLHSGTAQNMTALFLMKQMKIV